MPTGRPDARESTGSARALLAAVGELLFPPRCSSCEALLPGSHVAGEGEPADLPLCAPCGVALEPLGPCCRRCALPGRDVPRCVHCAAEEPPFASVRVPWLYGGAIADVVHRFKYEDRPELARPLGRGIAEVAAAEVDAVLPVPLHPSRRRQRTYDQALYLAREVARLRGIPCPRGWLRRVRATPRQVGSRRLLREENVRGAFAAGPQVAGQRILLVDDVVTTGATVAECARVLRAAGAALVHVGAVARAE